MDITEIYNLIGSMGFPIVAYLLMVKQSSDILEKLRKTIEDNNELIRILLEKNNITKG